MKISLIENGLDSLRKGYVHLETYEHLLSRGAGDAERFSALKDSVLSVQHGVEILFKYLLKEKNELLIYTDISKLKEAYKSRREGGIKELYEFEGVHTVTFKESIDRLRDICGVPMEEKLIKNLKKVEGWRNSITHSAVLLREMEVSRVLLKFLSDLDDFFGPLIGAPYLEGQGRIELDRTYKLTKAVYGELDNKIKGLTVERLIGVLQKYNVKSVTPSGSFIITEPVKAFSILKEMQGDEIRYGCDFKNLHSTGYAEIEDLSDENIVTIHAVDTATKYQFGLEALVVYIPEINNDNSPLIFIFARDILPKGNLPYIRSDARCTLQQGINLSSDNSFLWEKDDYDRFMEEPDYDCPEIELHRSAFRFLKKGPVCFMNVQKLKYGFAQRLLDDKKLQTPYELHTAFQEMASD